MATFIVEPPLVEPAAPADRIVYPAARTVGGVFLAGTARRNVSFTCTLTGVPAEALTEGRMFAYVHAVATTPVGVHDGCLVARAWNAGAVALPPPEGGPAAEVPIRVTLQDAGGGDMDCVLDVEVTVPVSGVPLGTPYPTQGNLVVSRFVWLPPARSASASVTVVPNTLPEGTVVLGDGVGQLLRGVVETFGPAPTVASVPPSAGVLALGSPVASMLRIQLPGVLPSASAPQPRLVTCRCTSVVPFAVGGGVDIVPTGADGGDPGEDGTTSVEIELPQTLAVTGAVTATGTLQVPCNTYFLNAAGGLSWTTATEPGRSALELVGAAAVAPASTPVDLGFLPAGVMAPPLYLTPRISAPGVVSVLLRSGALGDTRIREGDPLCTLQFTLVNGPGDFQWLEGVDEGPGAVSLEVDADSVPVEGIVVEMPFSASDVAPHPTLESTLARLGRVPPDVIVRVELQGDIVNVGLSNGLGATSLDSVPSATTVHAHAPGA